MLYSHLLWWNGGQLVGLWSPAAQCCMPALLLFVFLGRKAALLWWEPQPCHLQWWQSPRTWLIGNIKNHLPAAWFTRSLHRLTLSIKEYLIMQRTLLRSPFWQMPAVVWDPVIWQHIAYCSLQGNPPCCSSLEALRIRKEAVIPLTVSAADVKDFTCANEPQDAVAQRGSAALGIMLLSEMAWQNVSCFVLWAF